MELKEMAKWIDGEENIERWREGKMEEGRKRKNGENGKIEKWKDGENENGEVERREMNLKEIKQRDGEKKK